MIKSINLIKKSSVISYNIIEIHIIIKSTNFNKCKSSQKHQLLTPHIFTDLYEDYSL